MIQLTSGSFCSRKFVLATVCLIAITIVSALSVVCTGVGAILPTFIGGVLGVFVAYLGGNVAASSVQGKAEVAMQKAKSEQPKSS